MLLISLALVLWHVSAFPQMESEDLYKQIEMFQGSK